MKRLSPPDVKELIGRSTRIWLDKRVCLVTESELPTESIYSRDVEVIQEAPRRVR
jgi:hypothetical protein